MVKLTDKQLSDVLDFLQTVYRFRVELDLVPMVLQEPFCKAAARFRDPKELETLDRSKVGIAEEVADLAYQTLKMICLQKGILTETSIRALQDYMEKNNYYDSDGKLIGIDYRHLDTLSLRLAPAKLIADLRDLLPSALFVSKGDNGLSILKDFLAGQLVAYISRKWRGHKAGGLQTLEYVRDKKIPEETQELVEALVRSSENLAGDALLNHLLANVNLSRVLLYSVEEARRGDDTGPLFIHLANILRLKMIKPITVEDTLQFMFLKMKGRQELNFNGFDDAAVRRICKPVEYLIEADMFF